MLHRNAIATWGVLGVTALLGQAIFRLTPIALEPILDGSLTAATGSLYVAWVLVNGYTEGYRAFQKRFCPRVVGRSFHLAAHPRPLHVLFAAPYAMALFHARRRNLIVSWVTVLAIVSVVLAVRLLPQPWRGIIDGGVVVGLVWGVIALWVIHIRAIATGDVPLPEGVPDEELAHSGIATADSLDVPLRRDARRSEPVQRELA